MRRPPISKKFAAELIARADAASAQCTAIVMLPVAEWDFNAYQRARDEYHSQLVQLHGALLYYARGEEAFK